MKLWRKSSIPSILLLIGILLTFALTNPPPAQSEIYPPGITIITHGYQLDGIWDGENLPEWVEEMANAIRVRTGASKDDVYEVKYSKYTNQVSLEGGRLSIDIKQNGRAIILLNWVQVSNAVANQNYQTQILAEIFYNYLFNNTDLAQLPIHLIGHSRGVSLNNHIAYLLAQDGIVVDQETTIDPHPVTGLWADDWIPKTNRNTLFSDNYYQFGDGLHDFEGMPVVGAANFLLEWLFEPDETFSCPAHSLTHTYYHGTTAPNASSDGTCDIRDAWYASDSVRRTLGYNFSRSGNVDNRIRSGLSKYFYDTSGLPLGKGDRRFVQYNTVIPNAGFYKTSLSESSLFVGGSVEIPYYLSILGANITNDVSVSLFLDNDTNPYNTNEIDYTIGFKQYWPAYSNFGPYEFTSDSITWTPPAEVATYGECYIGLKSTLSGTNLVKYDYISRPITVTASQVDRPVILNISPRTLNALPLPQTQPIIINGTGFTPDTTLTFYDGTVLYENIVPVYNSSTQLSYDIVVGPDAATWTVYAENDGVRSNTSYPFYVEEYSIIPPTPATAPIASDGIYSDKIAIDWSTVSNTDTYRIYRCTTTSTGACDLIQETAQQNYNDYGPSDSNTYYYRIKACNEHGCSDYGPYDPGRMGNLMPPSQFNISASDGTYSGGVLVKWSPVSGAESYQVLRATSLTGNKIILSSELMVFSETLMLFGDTQVVSGRIYYYWVKACNSNGVCGELSASDTGYIGEANTIPNQAINPDPEDGEVNVSMNKDEVTWENGGDASKYEVYFGTDSTPDSGERIGYKSSTYYSLPDLGYDTTYYWRIDAINGDEITEGQVWSFTTRSPSVDLPNRAISPTPADDTRDVPITTSKISWMNGGGATSYDVYFGQNFIPGDDQYQGNTTATSWSLPYLEYGNHYFWKIKARNSGGTTNATIWHFVVEPPAPNTSAIWPSPVDQSVEVKTSGLMLHWTDPTDRATNFDVYLGTSPTLGEDDYQGNTIFSDWELPDLDLNTTYYWKVVSKNNAGEFQSDVWSFSTWETNPGYLSVSLGGFSSDGFTGGPFYPQSKSYTLKNTGNEPIVFTASSSREWLQISNPGQELQPGEQISLTATIGAPAIGLSNGYYSDTIVFNNVTNNQGNTVRTVALAAGEKEQPWDMASFAEGMFNTAAIKSNGALYVWGNNTYGQLGLGESAQQSSPNCVRIANANNWKSIALFYRHVLALDTQGRLFSWGENSKGELGLGDTDSRLSPVQVGSDTDWAQVAVGVSHSFALKKDGRLFAFGSNYEGRLGVGDTNDRTVPTQVGTDSDWKSVIPSGFSTLAIKEDGRLYTWGTNAGSDGSDVYSPVLIGEYSDVVKADGGTNHDFLAIRSNGQLYQIERRYSNSTGPIMIPVGNDSDWAEVAVGAQHFLALKNDGRLYGWGDNGQGQLGLGDLTDRIDPVLIMQDPDIISIRATESVSYALRKDGTVLAWGENGYGQLGLGYPSSRELNPRQVDLDWAVLNEKNGDFNGDYAIDLADVIICLKALTGQNAQISDPAFSDVDGNGQVGLPEIVNLLKIISE